MVTVLSLDKRLKQLEEKWPVHEPEWMKRCEAIKRDLREARELHDRFIDECLQRGLTPEEAEIEYFRMEMEATEKVLSEVYDENGRMRPKYQQIFDEAHTNVQWDRRHRGR